MFGEDHTFFSLDLPTSRPQRFFFFEARKPPKPSADRKREGTDRPTTGTGERSTVQLHQLTKHARAGKWRPITNLCVHRSDNFSGDRPSVPYLGTICSMFDEALYTAVKCFSHGVCNHG